MAYEFELKKDWPLVAAGGAGLLVVLLLLTSRTTTTQRQVQVRPGGDRSADLAAITAVEQARIAAQSQMFGVLVSGRVESERTAVSMRQVELSAEAVNLQTQAQLSAIKAQQQVQSQANLFGLIGSVLPFVFNLFCRDATERARQRRVTDHARLEAAYGGVKVYA